MNYYLKATAGVLAGSLMLTLPAVSAPANTDSTQAIKDTSSGQKGLYIVQLKGKSGIRHSVDLDSLEERAKYRQPSGRYDAQSPASQHYLNTLRNKQREVVAAVGGGEVLYHYGHTFNGFSVALTSTQVKALRSHPDVAVVWEDEAMTPDTANTPTFLGLTGPAGGVHDMYKGEGVIVGIIDSGINPDHPSFAGEGFSDPSELGWNGSCVVDEDTTFSCNNKLIGAKYFNATAAQAGEFASYEFMSPRDVDGHGSHVAGTAVGNMLPQALINNVDAGPTRGMAPRARLAAYKVCWDFSNRPAGCFNGDSFAAIEAAVEDGVDVLNFSISGQLSQLLDSASVAFLDAADAGVFVAGSAGNDGPGPGTVSKPVPWVMNVAASTYEGAVPALGMPVTGGSLSGEELIADEAGFTPRLTETGDKSGELMLASPLDACTSLDNDLTGKVALIKRGGCAFTVKVANAEAAGAMAAVVFNNVPNGAPFSMGGTPTSPIAIPAVMVGNNNGSTLEADLNGGTTVSATLTASIVKTKPVVGNIMANFSSRGPSLAVGDLIVPDITAPGVQILAAAPDASNFAYLQGTSMSSPHIAGLAALIKEAHPDWTPAMMMSAMMTTARQNVVKEDGTTPADPFDYGAGHVVPTKMTDPGFVYDAFWADYYAFVCGKADERALFESIYGAGTCAFVEGFGYAGGSEYNHPSIGADELGKPEFIVRFVTDVTGTEATYNANVVAPEGIDVTVYVYDGESFVPSTTMTVPANGRIAYALEMTHNDNVVIDAWKFGSITWENTTHSVRSPIAVRAVTPPLLDAPAEVSAQATASTLRLAVPITPDYNGTLNAQGHGMASELQPGVVGQDPDSDFNAGEPELGVHDITVAPGEKIFRVSLHTNQLSDTAADLDIFVFKCVEGDCSEQVGSSANSSSDEEVTFFNPEPLNDLAGGTHYRVYIHGWDLNGATELPYTLNVFNVDAQMSNLSIRARSTARQGRTTTAYANMKDLEAGRHYLGAISFTNGEGEEIGFTVLEVTPE
ncbi:S8 family serine peptidase [Aestuariibacter sp. AA17]|uniref:S8 family serine peptidase n=1 Tax=Fluctibacter corallii TaxID=2984329 RepID=A0ABT3A5F4_9ALTE|nr:S8 family serine peptidase [Aestuariibacter sp. AA17]MCV2883492.1 S8 family serine peptidase [Aestuariibacter sp. AA17]